jgi:mannan endo-1,4-beta-mannosidase
MIRLILLLFLGVIAMFQLSAQDGFVRCRGGQFILGNKPYYYLGANYWYGGILPLQKDPGRGIRRLQKELDFLQSKGVTNLRILAGAEGLGLVSGVERVGPPLQPGQGKFDPAVLDGLDRCLAEMAKRGMKAILFFSNNWEWSGGFLQYLRWNNAIPDSIFRRKLTWEETRDYTSRFYGCEGCKKDYLKQVAFVLGRKNTITGRAYVQDPTIMAWELANEPRPMRPASTTAYAAWIKEVSAFIRSRDKKHLITTGHEGEIGTESLPLFESVHTDRNIDYLTIHIWPRNWGWYQPGEMKTGFATVLSKTSDYIQKHVDVARQLNKPLVIEEFGFPRDDNAFDPASTTMLRDQYYESIFSTWKKEKEKGGVLAGVNFWAFNGTARPVMGQAFWKKGDDYMGDPPMEEQGLYGVFDSDHSTWALIQRYSGKR